MKSKRLEMPLFPLRTVLFPGGVLPLRIFEPRYTDMVGRCMREGIGFGVVLIRQGEDVLGHADAKLPEIFDVGTEARIIDFNQADNGLLGIVVEGARKFSVRQVRTQADRLMLGDVEFLADEPAGELAKEHEPLVEVLQELTSHPLIKKLNLQVNFSEARSVSLRLSELLPIEPEIKQSLLQMRWPRERLAELGRLVKKFQG